MRLSVCKGANDHVLANRAEINPRDLLDQDKRIPFRKYMALMRAAKLACNDPALGLHCGEALGGCVDIQRRPAGPRRLDHGERLCATQTLRA